MSSTGVGLQGFLPFVIIGIKLDRFDGLPRDGVTLLACITHIVFIRNLARVLVL